jgi:hypothetical protein
MLRWQFTFILLTQLTISLCATYLRKESLLQNKRYNNKTSIVNLCTNITNFNCYHSHEQTNALLQRLTILYPQQAHVYTIGKSVEGQSMTVIAISGKEAYRHVALRPEIRLMANIHGDEVFVYISILYK